MARPKKQIDFKYLKTICQRPISSEDIAAILGVSKDTLERAVKRELKMGLAAFKQQNLASLRLTILDQQLSIMKKGNSSMAIFLGKQYCGQTDKVETKEVGNPNQVVVYRSYNPADLKEK